jgi:hypothetical protein
VGRMTVGELMRWLRKTFLSALVWLTAATTLVAGAPHFTCRCPDGRVKLFCLGSAFKKSGCCCNGECCCAKAGTACRCTKTSAPDPKPVKASCCCGRHGEPAPKVRAQTGGSFTASCCTKTLVQPDLSTFQYPEEPALKDATLAVLLAPQPPVIGAAPSEPCFFRLEHQRPPPTDLVIALQHFLI